jgi:hypothetical protein
MLDYISYGPPTGPAPSNQAGQNNSALAADIANGALYVSVPGGIWKPVGGGLVAASSLTGQTSASNAVTLYTPTGVTTGMYSLDWYTKLTTTGTSPVLGPLVVTYKDAVDSTSQSVTAAGQTQAGAAATSLTATTTAQILSGNLCFNAGSAAAIVATLTVSGTIGAAVYELYFRLEYLG